MFYGDETLLTSHKISSFFFFVISAKLMIFNATRLSIKSQTGLTNRLCILFSLYRQWLRCRYWAMGSKANNLWLLNLVGFAYHRRYFALRGGRCMCQFWSAQRHDLAMRIIVILFAWMGLLFSLRCISTKEIF